MGNSDKYHIQLVLFGMILLAACGVYISRVGLNALVEWTPTLIVVALFYIFSHLFRSLRLWVVISQNTFSISDAAFVQFLSSALGNIAFPFVKELSATFLFNLQLPKAIPRILIALLYVRIFDFSIIIPLLLLTSYSAPAEVRILALILLTMLVMALFIIFLMPRLCQVVIEHLLKYHHSPISLWSVATLSQFISMYYQMKLGKVEVAFIVLFLSLLCWLTESVAVYAALSQDSAASILDTLHIITNNVSTNIPFFTQYSDMHSMIYIHMYMGLTLASFILLLRVMRKTR